MTMIHQIHRAVKNLAIKNTLVSTMAPKMKIAKFTTQTTQDCKRINQNFSLKVGMNVIQQRLAENKSVVCSPLSVDTILSILAIGAKNSTLHQLLKLLGHVDVGELTESSRKLSRLIKGSDYGPKIASVNALWLDRRFSLKSAFEKVLTDVHRAHVRVVDFINEVDEMVDDANSWAKENTNGLIKQIVTRNNVNHYTSFLLANALYFKGTWLNSFNPTNTEDADFSLLDGAKIQVPFMNQWDQNFDYGTTDECQVLQMPYNIGGYSDYEDYLRSPKSFSMYVFLPHENNGLPNLMKKMMIDPISYIDKVELESSEITKLSIPKFNFESDIDLKKPMEALGLTLPFEENCRDFSGIIDIPEPLYISDVFQKCQIETNEQGTEATAVICDVGLDAAAPPTPSPPPIKFVADHPFMFMIREDVSGTILFVGTMLDPK